MEPFIDKQKLNEISQRWDEAGVFKAQDASDDPKKYVLDMFPYPSGDGLHVGHVEGYTGSDIIARYYRAKGYNVLHPMGWDAFGLPAENYAIKQGVHPQETTDRNIDRFRNQMQSMGFSYDWSREVNTSSPGYYKWTQWLFLKFYDAGIAYRKKAKANWCDSCKTVLANEQVVDGACERCGSQVMQKELEQWFFKITDYADRLINGLDKLDWPENIKTMQRNWIGKSEGAELSFDIENTDDKILVFTTRPDTLYGATYIVLAPEHPLVYSVTLENRKSDIGEYRLKAEKKTVLERTKLNEKSGVFTGSYAVHPITHKKLPIWVADYVITEYGEGAVMAVPAHDKRDFEFAKKYDLPIINVIEAPTDASEEVYTGFGKLINSDNFNGLESNTAKDKIINKAGGKKKTQYRLRDWLVSRQRYCGAPIPIVYCDKCGTVPVPESDLPVKLPTDVDFHPTGDSPLKLSKTFHDVACPKCGGEAKRESDTMDTFVCSSWYFLRFCDPHNQNVAFDGEKIKGWMPVDVYIGGAEHAVLHLLYARFITKFLSDSKHIEIDEPFVKLRNQGMVLGPDKQKMSKSRGNVVNPDEIVDNYGPDVLRLYEIFMGPFNQVKPWDSKSIEGVFRFIKKLIQFYINAKPSTEVFSSVTSRLVKSTAKKIETEQFNTCVSDFMKHLTYLTENDYSEKDISEFLIAVNPFMPFTAELMWQNLGKQQLLANQKWPEPIDETKQTKYTVVVQVNGKFRGTIVASDSDDKASITSVAKNLPAVKRMIGSAKPEIVYVPSKVINFTLE